MSFEADFLTHLLTDPAVGAIVNHISAINRPQAEQTPAATYHVDQAPVNSLDGFTSQLTHMDVQVTCWGLRMELARGLADAIKLRLQTAAQTFSALVLNAASFYDDEIKLYYIEIDISAWYRAS